MELDQLKKQAAYIKGLMDGLDINESTGEGRILRAMSELLCGLTDTVCNSDEDLSDLYDIVDDMNEGIKTIAKDVYGDAIAEDDEDEDEDSDSSDEGSSEELRYEVACPACGETVYVSESDLDAGEAVCPSCQSVFEVALADEDEDVIDGPVQYDVTCPHCGETSTLDEDSLLGDDPVCPHCGKPIIVDAEDK